jgi:23S rRNA pseudouridine2605 synthase
MRLNKFIAQATGLSRRAADTAIEQGRVAVNGQQALMGQQLVEGDAVTLDNQPVTSDVKPLTIMLNKPVGYVCSRNGQGSQTIYDLLPEELHILKPVGRLDKDSSGLLLLTSDGELANQLTHPRYQKTKVYEITLDKPLQPLHQQMITDHGVMLDDGLSRFEVTGSRLPQGQNVEEATTSNLSPTTYQITMSEGRNRQIRRTFAALSYEVIALKRTTFGNYQLAGLSAGMWQEASD